MISTVNGVNRVLYLKIFHDRLANVVRNGPVVSVIIRASRKFQNIARGALNTHHATYACSRAVSGSCVPVWTTP